MSTTLRETFFRCSSWQEAEKLSLGYQDDTLVERLVEKNRINPVWKNQHNDYLNSREVEFSCALMRAEIGSNNDKVKVADFGGGNGYMAITARRILPWVEWEWTVYESSVIASAYSEFENDANIRWRHNENSIFIDEFDVGLISCTLQYLIDPWIVLKNLALKSKYIIIMRIPFVDSNDHIITRQTFNEGLHHEVKGSWPAWFFSRSKFDAELEKLGTVVYRWKTPTETLLFEGETIKFEGVLLKSDN
jgi:putative methyltransferase (TIGR04325 family)